MEANELRIGNYVEHEDANEIVEGIHYNNENDYLLLIGNYLRPIKEIKPVPLTEDWLLRFGFERQKERIYNKTQLPNGGNNGFHNAVEYLNKSNNQVLYGAPYEGAENGYHYIFGSVTTDFGEDYISKKVEFVHQLQNLYFALTGKELELNPNA